MKRNRNTAYPPKRYFTPANSSANESLYPFLCKKINELHPSSVLDFGCGDGRLWDHYPVSGSSTFKLHLYDPLMDELEPLLKQTLGEKFTYLISEKTLKEQVPLVVCSLVLMAICEDDKFMRAIELVSQNLQAGGTGFFAITHPCFLDRPNSDFITSYEMDPESFDYTASGKPFDVQLKSMLENPILLQDTFRSLESYAKAFSQNDLLIANIHEIICPTTKKYVEKQRFPSFMVFEVSKIERG